MSLDDGEDGVEDDEPLHVGIERMKSPVVVREIYEKILPDLLVSRNWKYSLGSLNYSALY